MTDELSYQSATALAQLMRAREVTAVAVVEAHLRRIEAANGDVNAIVQLDAERALAQAATADGALARGEPAGPLHGVPFTVKDNLEAAGLAMAIGAPGRAGVVPAGDATAVARLRAAGAILLGKTNCPRYGGGIETDNEVYGRTNNPYDLARPAAAAAARRPRSRRASPRSASGPIRERASGCPRTSAASPASSRRPVALPSPASWTTAGRSARWETPGPRSGCWRAPSPTSRSPWR